MINPNDPEVIESELKNEVRQLTQQVAQLEQQLGDVRTAVCKATIIVGKRGILSALGIRSQSEGFNVNV